jgi:two-component system, cell cycle response regulator
MSYWSGQMQRPTHIAAHERRSALRLIIQNYVRLLLVGFAILPACSVVYIYFCQDPTLKFEDHSFHEIAIAVAILEGLFVTYASWRCYQSSREPLLRWLTLSFLSFVLIYAPHGAFTGLAHHNIWLFLLYGPASRFAMALLLFIGLLSYRQPPNHEKASLRSWALWIAVFLLVDIAVAWVANSAFADHPAVRLSMEGGALFLSAVNVSVMLSRRIFSPLMVIFGISVTWYALSSFAFILAVPWNHMWWLAHAIFAAGFFLLSYGVAHAYLTTRSFSTIYSQEVLMARLSEAMAGTQRAMQEVQKSNQKLEQLAATDPLTGAGNRRQFIERIENEIARFQRDSAPFCLLALDLDHFKAINDSYGHLVGDDVLQKFVQKCVREIRPHDFLARMGGEEFMVLLPQTRLEAACLIGERLRSAVSASAFSAGGETSIEVTISIGASEFGRDGNTLNRFLLNADERLFRAKHYGRNCLIAA